MKKILYPSLLIASIILTRIAQAQLKPINTNNNIEFLINSFQSPQSSYHLYQVNIGTSIKDIHLLEISDNGIQNNRPLIQYTDYELDLINAQLFNNHFYLFYNLYANDNSDERLCKLDIFELNGTKLSSILIDSTNNEIIDVHVINNRLLFQTTKGFQKNAYSINALTYTLKNETNYLELFSKHASLIYEDTLLNRAFLYRFEDNYQNPDEKFMLFQLNLSDTSIAEMMLDMSKFKLSQNIDIVRVKALVGDTIILHANTYAGNQELDKYELSYSILNDTYAAKLYPSTCLDQKKSNESTSINISYNNSRFTCTANFPTQGEDYYQKIGFVNEENSTACYQTKLSAKPEDSIANALLKQQSIAGLLGLNARDNLIALKISTNPKSRLVYVVKPLEKKFKSNYFYLDSSTFTNNTIPMISQKNGTITILLALQFENQKPHLYAYNLTLEDILSNTQNLSLANAHIAHYFEQHIYFNTNGTNASTHIFNLLGQSWNMGMNNNKIDVSFLPTGIYIAHIQQGNTIQRLKFFKP